MTNNSQSNPAESAILSSSATEAAVAPSCYRVSVASGALEVSARLKNADDLELILKVLEANKALFTKEDRSAKDIVLKVTKTFANSYTPEAETRANAERSATSSNRLTEILTP
jgi:hypothetical protein